MVFFENWLCDFIWLVAPVIHLCVRAPQGMGDPCSEDQEQWGLPGAAGQDLASHLILPLIQEQGSQEALVQVGTGGRQYCGITGAGADDTRENGRGSWAVGRVE